MEKLEKALELRKAKYLKRTGSPGNYKYVYREEKGEKKLYGSKEVIGIQSMGGESEAIAPIRGKFEKISLVLNEIKGVGTTEKDLEFTREDAKRYWWGQDENSVNYSERFEREKRIAAKNKKRVMNLVKILRSGGSLKPVVLNSNNMLIDGSHRVLAYRLAGVKGKITVFRKIVKGKKG